MPPVKKDITAQNIEDVMRIAKRIYGPAKVEKLGLFDRRPTVVKGFEGPLPDVLGYQQHGGECASDAIQEMLMFADGIREYTQPIVYGLTPEQFDLRSKLTLPYTEWKRYTDYFKYLQKRFRAHYDVLNAMRKQGIKGQKYLKEFEEVCMLNPIFGQKKRLSPEVGVLALKRLKEELVYTESGMTDTQIRDTYTTMLRWLGVPFVLAAGDDVARSGRQPVAIQIAGLNNIVRSDKVFQMPKSGHATGFLVMNGELFHYDDNYGLMKAGKGVIDALLEGKMVYVTVRRNRYFCRIARTYNVNFMTEYPKIQAVWKDGKWDKDAVSVVLEEDGTLRRGSEIFLPRSEGTLALIGLDAAPYHETKETDCIKFGNGKAKSLDEFNEMMARTKACIFSNPTSNSYIFENMYHYAFDNFEFLKQSPEFLKMISISVNSVVTRVACTPMTHAWCFYLHTLLTDLKIDLADWFEISGNLPAQVYHYGATPDLDASPMTPMTPNAEDLEEMKKLEELRRLDAEAKKRVDEEERKKIQEQREKEKEKEKLSPCPEGQVRDRKTRKCRDKTEENLQKAEVRKEAAQKRKEEKKAKGENGTKKAKKGEPKEPKKPKVYVF